MSRRLSLCSIILLGLACSDLSEVDRPTRTLDEDTDTGSERYVRPDVESGLSTAGFAPPVQRDTQEARDTVTDDTPLPDGTDTNDLDDDTDTLSGRDTEDECARLGWDCGGVVTTPAGIDIECGDMTCPSQDGLSRICIDNTCVSCHTDSLCGPACVPCGGATPVCSANGTRCVECNRHEDCQSPQRTAWPSVTGICTPDHTCTCYTPPNDSNLTCDAPEFVCPSEYACVWATDQDARCLRSCEGPESIFFNGMACQGRRHVHSDATSFVWIPASDCFSYMQLGTPCEADEDCRLLDDSDDGICVTRDGDARCSFSCQEESIPSDHLCPGASRCEPYRDMMVCSF